MSNYTLPCSTCSKFVVLEDVKYYTEDQQHVFCEAECSHKWYLNNHELYKKVKTYSNEDKF